MSNQNINFKESLSKVASVSFLSGGISKESGSNRNVSFVSRKLTEEFGEMAEEQILNRKSKKEDFINEVIDSIIVASDLFYIYEISAQSSVEQAHEKLIEHIKVANKNNTITIANQDYSISFLHLMMYSGELSLAVQYQENETYKTLSDINQDVSTIEEHTQQLLAKILSVLLNILDCEISFDNYGKEILTDMAQQMFDKKLNKWQQKAQETKNLHNH